MGYVRRSGRSDNCTLRLGSCDNFAQPVSNNSLRSKIPVISGELGVDVTDESHARQMKRHSPHVVRLKRDKRTRRIVAVFLSAPELTQADWREPHRPVSSLTATKLEAVDRHGEPHYCQFCHKDHGGHGRGPGGIIVHKTGTIDQWRHILRREMRPLYVTRKEAIPPD